MRVKEEINLIEYYYAPIMKSSLKIFTVIF